jgi:hypothetical protein
LKWVLAAGDVADSENADAVYGGRLKPAIAVGEDFSDQQGAFHALV